MDEETVEIIVVNDGSTDGTGKVLEECPFIRSFSFEQNRGRLAARNFGMQQATHEWICWLDSDDEYVSTYLEMINHAITKYPQAKIFNFGAIVHDKSSLRSWVRDTFMPGLQASGGGHVKFKSGGIGTGSFVFKRELLSDTGFLPEARTPYGDAASLPAMATAIWPELKELYGQTKEGQWLPFGNPWGDDWLMFYLLTRNNVSQPLEIKPYIQHLRT